MKKYFEYKDDKSSKFWEISLVENKLTTRYGKIGTDGQISDKPFDNMEKAIKEYNKLVTEKTKKGYVEVENKEVKVKMKQA
jgi:predicted DNA-binding WGR domain protein